MMFLTNPMVSMSLVSEDGAEVGPGVPADTVWVDPGVAGASGRPRGRGRGAHG